jgi:hypothetical protein
MVYQIAAPKFKMGSKVIVNSNSSPYKGHTGVIEGEPAKDTFRFWYIVKFESNGLTVVGRFAEEQLGGVVD